MFSKYGGERGLFMVPWEVCTMPKEEGGFGLIDMLRLKVVFYAAKWTVICLEGSTPW